MKTRGAAEVSSELRTVCQANYVPMHSLSSSGSKQIPGYLSSYSNRNTDADELTLSMIMHIIKFTHMPSPSSGRAKDTKAEALRSCGALHPNPAAVKDEVFHSHEFFDPQDRVQVKYEMLRRHRVDGRPVTEVAKAFGVSRQAFYKSAATLEGQGIPGLLPRRRGPKRARKCTDEVLEFAERWQATAVSHRGGDVVQAIERKFGIRLHPRSLDRAIARHKKKRQARGKQQR